VKKLATIVASLVVFYIPLVYQVAKQSIKFASLTDVSKHDAIDLSGWQLCWQTNKVANVIVRNWLATSSPTEMRPLGDG